MLSLVTAQLRRLSLHLVDLALQLQLRGQATGVLENLVGKPQVLRDRAVVLEPERLSAAFQVVELAPLDRLPDLALGHQMQAEHGPAPP
jgi:hypothetical protein